MRSFRHISAWILLLVLVTAIAPQEVWHAHEHGQLAHADEGAATVDASCTICDVGMPVAMGTPEVELAIVSTIVFHATSPAIAGTSLGFTPLAADRGPPSLA